MTIASGYFPVSSPTHCVTLSWPPNLIMDFLRIGCLAVTCRGFAIGNDAERPGCRRYAGLDIRDALVAIGRGAGAFAISARSSMANKNGSDDAKLIDAVLPGSLSMRAPPAGEIAGLW